jgi:hypothetical protein
VALKFPADYDFMEANRFPSEWVLLTHGSGGQQCAFMQCLRLILM